MRSLVIAASLFFAVYLALTPPGLCPCWLMAEPDKFHPHPSGRPERPHGHDYLFDLFQSQTLSAIPLAITPARLLIERQSGDGLWRPLAAPMFFTGGWASSPLTPPPRP